MTNQKPEKECTWESYIFEPINNRDGLVMCAEGDNVMVHLEGGYVSRLVYPSGHIVVGLSRTAYTGYGEDQQYQAAS